MVLFHTWKLWPWMVRVLLRCTGKKMLEGRQQHEQQLEQMKQDHELEQSQLEHEQNLQLRSLEVSAKLGQSPTLASSFFLLQNTL